MHLLRPCRVACGWLVFTTIVAASPVQAQFDSAADRPVPAGAARRVADSLAASLTAWYVDSTLALEYAAAIRRHAGAGTYDTITSSLRLAERLSADLTAVQRDGHLGVQFVGEENPTAPPPNPAALAESRRRWNAGWQRVELLPGNIGYFRFDGFSRPDAAVPIADAALTFLQGADALIIDLRENRGGSPQLVAYLVTRLLPKGRNELLNTIWTRRDGVARQYWTMDGIPGERFERPVYILTSSKTVSAAEEFAYDLRVLKRATIVGETTLGGANPGGMSPLPAGFAVFIPGGRAINPVTGTNWEGVGVAPDVAVSAALALMTAHRMALEELLPTVTDEDFRREIETVLKGMRARK